VTLALNEEAGQVHFVAISSKELESMKRIMEIGTYKAGDSRLEVLDLTNLEVTVNENAAVFVGRTTVTSLTAGQTASDSYHISRTYLKQRSQWRLVASERNRLGKPNIRPAKHIYRSAA
jgi:hypothetical protein